MFINMFKKGTTSPHQSFMEKIHDALNDMLHKKGQFRYGNCQYFERGGIKSPISVAAYITRVYESALLSRHSIQRLVLTRPWSSCYSMM